jgi:opacity protein-like surface antigen
MITKKMLLLAVSAMALVAFAVPAAAQAEAPEWLTEGSPITSAEELHLEGEWNSVMSTGLEIGPCAVTFSGAVENANGMAGGRITAGNVAAPCSTNKENCSVTAVTLNIPEGGWNLTGTTVTEQEGVEIQNASFTRHFNSAANCGLPVTSVTATGTVTGIVEEGCLSFEGHPDNMSAFGGLVKVDLQGVVCDTHLTLG